MKGTTLAMWGTGPIHCVVGKHAVRNTRQRRENCQQFCLRSRAMDSIDSDVLFAGAPIDAVPAMQIRVCRVNPQRRSD